MKPTDLSRTLAKTIAARIPILIVGPPGVGKSDLVAKAAEDAGADLIVSHPAVADPTDAKGLPWISDEKDAATFLPFGELARALKATRLTLWFLDDLGQATAAVQASFMQLILARRINGHILPDCVVFVAASNRRTDRAGVSGILEPVKSRFGAILELTPDLDDWCSWAFSADLPPELIAFLRFRPDLLCNFEPTADLSNSPLPRTWHNAARLLALDLPDKALSEAIAGAVGGAAAAEFLAFRRLYAELPSIDGILLDPDAADIPDRPGTLYAVVTALGMRANVQNFARVARYAERLFDAAKGEFSALLLKDVVRRDPAVTQSPAFVRLATGELGQLIGGTVQ